MSPVQAVWSPKSSVSPDHGDYADRQTWWVGDMSRRDFPSSSTPPYWGRHVQPRVGHPAGHAYTTNEIAYERDKSTRRTSRAHDYYDEAEARHRFTSSTFVNGYEVPAQLFSDFENWKVGTHGWAHYDDSQFNPRQTV